MKIKELLKGNCDMGYFRDGKDDHKDDDQITQKRPDTEQTSNYFTTTMNHEGGKTLGITGSLPSRFSSI